MVQCMFTAYLTHISTTPTRRSFLHTSALALGSPALSTFAQTSATPQKTFILRCGWATKNIGDIGPRARHAALSGAVSAGAEGHHQCRQPTKYQLSTDLDSVSSDCRQIWIRGFKHAQPCNLQVPLLTVQARTTTRASSATMPSGVASSGLMSSSTMRRSCCTSRANFTSTSSSAGRSTAG